MSGMLRLRPLSRHLLASLLPPVAASALLLWGGLSALQFRAIDQDLALRLSQLGHAYSVTLTRLAEHGGLELAAPALLPLSTDPDVAGVSLSAADGRPLFRRGRPDDGSGLGASFAIGLAQEPEAAPVGTLALVLDRHQRQAQVTEEAVIHLALMVALLLVVTLVLLALGRRKVDQPLQQLMRLLEQCRPPEPAHGRPAAALLDTINPAEGAGRTPLAPLLALGQRLKADLERESTRQRQHQERLELALAATAVGLWELEPLNGDRWWSPGIRAMLGRRADDRPLTTSDWRALVHGDDLAAVENAIEQYLAGESPDYRVRYRLRHQSGAWLWVEEAGQAARLPQGQVSRFAGTLTDITERRRGAQALESHRRLLRAVIDTIPAAITVRDLEGRFVLVNRFQAELWGVQPDAMVGCSAQEVLPPGGGAHPFDRDLIEAGQPLPLAENSATDRNGALRQWLVAQAPLVNGPAALTLVVTAALDVTSQKAAEAALRRREERLELALLATRAAVWDLDLRTGRRWWSPEFLQLLGRPPGSLTITESWRQLVHPDDRDWVHALARRHLAGQLPEFRAQYRLRCADGHWLWIEDVGRAQRAADGTAVRFLGTVIDISARKQTEAALVRKSAVLEQTLEHLPLGIALFDETLTLAAANRLYCRILGLPEALMVAGTPYEAFVRCQSEAELGDSAEIEPRVAARVAQAHRRQPRTQELRRSDGRVIELRHVPTSDGGFLAIAGDISDRRHAEEDLRAAKEQAETAVRAQSAFLATTSHEIRTSLSSITAMADLLEETPLGRDQQGMAGVIRSSARTLLAMVNDLLDFSKIEAGRIELEAADLSVSTVAEDVIDLMAGRAAEKNLELVLSVAPGLADQRRGDPLRLRQILLNLTANAITFTDHGHVAIEIGPSQCPARAAPAGGALVRFAVHDTGIGLSPDQMSRLFEPFAQADASISRRFGGTGLGLSICRHLVQLMGGEIGVVSTPGSGTSFWFELPLAPALASASAPGVTVAPDLGGLSLLVVEGSPVLAEALFRSLSDRGAAVTVVGTASEALMLTADSAGHGPGFTVVVVDAVLPDFSGLELARRLAALAPAAAAPAPRPVLLAALSDLAQLTDDPADRALITLTKPLRRERLWRAVALAAGLTPEGEARPGRHPHRPPPPPAAEARAAGKLILVAEDNPTNQVVVRRLLARLGYACEIVADGNDAWARLEEGGYGLLLTDCHMPEMDGFELARRVRAREMGSDVHLPILALTADTLPETEARCRAAGIDGHLTKPVELERLDAILSHWLPGSGSSAGGGDGEDMNGGLDGAPGLGADPPPAPPAAESPPATGTPAVLDPEVLGDVFDGITPEARDLVRQFLSNLSDQIRQIRALLADGRLERAVDIAHSCKGAAYAIGAQALAQLCAELEGQLRQGRREAAEQLARRLEPEQKRLTATLETF